MGWSFCAGGQFMNAPIVRQSLSVIAISMRHYVFGLMSQNMLIFNGGFMVRKSETLHLFAGSTLMRKFAL